MFSEIKVPPNFQTIRRHISKWSSRSNACYLELAYLGSVPSSQYTLCQDFFYETSLKLLQSYDRCSYYADLCLFCKIEPDLEKVGEVSLIQLTILGRTTGTHRDVGADLHQFLAIKLSLSQSEKAFLFVIVWFDSTFIWTNMCKTI